VRLLLVYVVAGDDHVELAEPRRAHHRIHDLVDEARRDERIREWRKKTGTLVRVRVWCGSVIKCV
jgi:hypothetical protein